MTLLRLHFFILPCFIFCQNYELSNVYQNISREDFESHQYALLLNPNVKFERDDVGDHFSRLQFSGKTNPEEICRLFFGQSSRAVFVQRAKVKAKALATFESSELSVERSKLSSRYVRVGCDHAEIGLVPTEFLPRFESKFEILEMTPIELEKDLTSRGSLLFKEKKISKKDFERLEKEGPRYVHRNGFLYDKKAGKLLFHDPEKMKAKENEMINIIVDTSKSMNQLIEPISRVIFEICLANNEVLKKIKLINMGNYGKEIFSFKTNNCLGIKKIESEIERFRYRSVGNYGSLQISLDGDYLNVALEKLPKGEKAFVITDGEIREFEQRRESLKNLKELHEDFLKKESDYNSYSMLGYLNIHFYPVKSKYFEAKEKLELEISIYNIREGESVSTSTLEKEYEKEEEDILREKLDDYVTKCQSHHFFISNLINKKVYHSLDFKVSSF